MSERSEMRVGDHDALYHPWGEQKKTVEHRVLESIKQGLGL